VQRRLLLMRQFLAMTEQSPQGTLSGCIGAWQPYRAGLGNNDVFVPDTWGVHWPVCYIGLSERVERQRPSTLKSGTGHKIEAHGAEAEA
jgi:hypothetical protein